MEIRDYLGDDGLAMLALCSPLGLPAAGSGREASPFTPSEWNKLARQIRSTPLGSPAALQGRDAASLASDLSLPADEAERIAALLGRAGRLALEVENCFSRGIWIVSRADAFYPARLRARLKHLAPPVLFGAGEIRLLEQGGVAVVGSRKIDEAGAAFAVELGRRAAKEKAQVISGGARGTDRLAMTGALEAGGIAIGVLADSLERTVRQADLRQQLIEQQLVLFSPYTPTAGFTVGNAMGRNKLIYALADFTVVVSSEHETGGTWAGAVDALKAGWCPVYVREAPGAPKGNQELVKLGAHPLPEAGLSSATSLQDWFREHARPRPVELDLFQSPPEA